MTGACQGNTCRAGPTLQPRSRPLSSLGTSRRHNTAHPEPPRSPYAQHSFAIRVGCFHNQSKAKALVAEELIEMRTFIFLFSFLSMLGIAKLGEFGVAASEAGC